ncbi:MAG TPA: hypothetical protein DCZ94_18530 [Lentisphaeria bacterium]|nr:MAG: hypothetical protein A2X48_24090 [Lentisphaerae bacterium GWF2_49_21]HBC88943.1 hypothetical protein [Lentisphaeria bacterium]
MKISFARSFRTALCAAVFFAFAGAAAYAQGLSFFQPAKDSDKKRSGKVPTVINSDTMDIDISKNLAVFSGNVKVDDEEMGITCKKMTIFIEDKKEPQAPPAVKKAEPADTEVSPEESKQISRIICEGDVVIIRKSDDEKEKADGEQRAEAGHADYDVKTGRIVLTKNPVLKRKEDVLKGEVIIIFRDSEKIEVHRGGEIRLSDETVENKPAEEPVRAPAPEKTEDKTQQPR